MSFKSGPMVPVSIEAIQGWQASMDAWWDEVTARLLFGPVHGPGRAEWKRTQLHPRRLNAPGILADTYLAHRCDR